MDESTFRSAAGSTATSTTEADGGYDATSGVTVTYQDTLADAGGSTPGLTPRLESAQLAAAYRLIAELLLYPEQRDEDAIAAYRGELDEVPEAAEPIDAFMASPRAHDLDEYLMLLELAPTCPLYLGTYLFEEPSSCRGAGLSDRNAYMIELKAIYRHFGFEPAGNEMADFLPLVSEFLALALDREALDEIGLRRRLLELHVAPALKALREKLETYESPYAGLVACMTRMVERDAAGCPEPARERVGVLELPTLKPFTSPSAGPGSTLAGPPTEAQR